jgi:hypothetical protein
LATGCHLLSLIEDGSSISFAALKSTYLQKAQQLLSLRIPKDEIQDDALRRILLDLQKDGVVIRLKDLTYQVQFKVPLEAWAMEEMKQALPQRTLKPKILAIIERESGVHTPEGLVRRLHEQGAEVTFEEVDELLYELRGFSGLKLGPAGKLEFVPPYTEKSP